MRSHNTFTVKDEMNFNEDDSVFTAFIEEETLPIIEYLEKKYGYYLFADRCNSYVALAQFHFNEGTYHDDWYYGVLADTIYQMGRNFYMDMVNSWYLNWDIEERVEAEKQYYKFEKEVRKILQNLVPHGWIDYCFPANIKDTARTILAVKGLIK